MNDATLGISIKNGMGHYYRRTDKGIRSARAIAGKAFAKPETVSVCVYDRWGVAILYMKKMGKGVYKESVSLL